MPSRSDIEAWDTTHLEDAATHWRSTATRWESHFETIHSGMLRPGGATWEGAAADAAVESSWADVMTVRGAGDALHSAAGFASEGAGDIHWAKTQVLAAIEEAEAEGFTVAQDFSVRDESAGPLMRTTVARQQQAQAFATEIAARVQTLVEIDAQAAAQITSALSPLEGVQFPEDGHSGDPTVQMADYGFKRDEPKPPPPPPGPNSGDIRSVLDQLPEGSRSRIREVRSVDDLRKLSEWMTQQGTEGHNRYGDPAKGIWKDLPDGAKVGERAAAKSTGDPSLDIDLQNLDGTVQHWKVHVNEQKGAEPNIPQPKAAEGQPSQPRAAEGESGGAEAGPGESAGSNAPTGPAPAAKPAPAGEAPAAEAGPALRPAPAEGGGVGAPASGPMGPQPVHPPGSIHHPFPILGEDDPEENPRDFEGH